VTLRLWTGNCPFGTSTQQSWIHRSTDGGLEFHTGNGCRSTSTPGTCKIELYPAEVSLASGSVSGNTITVNVPVAGGFGANRPILGTTLYSVTGFTFGRNGDTDLISADVDASHAFDFRLGSR